MKKIFQKLLQKFVTKKVAEAVANADVEPIVPGAELVPEPVEGTGDSKKAVWKFIIQTLISILTAILTALGATSCVVLH